jgi:hypothetical protein
MTSVRVHFSPGYPLGGGFPTEQFLQHGGKRPQVERRGCSSGILLLFGGGVFRGDLLRQYSEFRREGNFPESKGPGFARAVFEIRRAPQDTGFFAPAVFYSRTGPGGCSALREILILEEIQG